MNQRPDAPPVRLTTRDDNPGPFRVGSHWKVTVVYDPNYDPAATAKTGILVATAQTQEMAARIVDALNAQDHGVWGEPAQRLH